MRKLGIFFLLLVFGHISSAQSKNHPHAVGLAHAYVYQIEKSEISVLIKFPVDPSGRIINWTEQAFNYLPDKFVIGTGTLVQPFLRIDKSSGSKLHNYITELKFALAKKLKYENPANVPEEKVLRYLAYHFEEFLAWAEEDEDISVHGWYPDSTSLAQFDEVHAERLKSLFTLPVGDWIETDHQHFSVPIEHYLFTKKGYCIDMALLASFLLESFNIRHHVVFGSVLEDDFNGGGHTWIQLPNGRILDVAWGTLALPRPKKHPAMKDWMWFGNSKGYQYRYEYGFFPIVQF